MRFFFSVLAVICMAHPSVAQKELPAFGKIDVADLLLKDCSFDPGAEAFKLIDWGNMYFISNPNEPSSFTTVYERRVRVKILKEAGLSYANLSIPFLSDNNNEKIISIAACTYNVDGNQVKKVTVYKNARYNRKIDRQYGEMIIVFPEVKIGSVIEYKYSIQGKVLANIKDWYFQSSIPTRYSEYQVSIPSAFRISISPLTVDSLEKKETTYTDHSFVKTFSVSAAILQKNFIMRNLPAIQNEPCMSSAKDYLQRLSIRLSGIDYGNGNVVNTSGNWDAVVKELNSDRDFGAQISRQIPGAADIIAKANELPVLETKIAFLYDYVKNNMRWNGRQNIYADQGIKTAFQNKNGSSGDINLLLVSILNRANIPAKPILFSTRDNGQVDKNLPFTDQFNTVMAFVQNQDKSYVLDATDKYNPCNLVPLKVANTTGFVVDSETGRWQDMADTVNAYRVITAVRAEIDTATIMKGDALISKSGYAKVKYWEEQDDANQKITATEFTSAGVDSLEINNPADLLPLEQKLRFSIPLSSTGDHRYFKINLFSGLEKNRFVASKRRTDIDFGYRQEYTIYGNYTIPVNYEFEELPANISLIMPDTSIVFRRFISADNNSLNVRMTVNFRRSLYTAGEYPEFAAFYKTLLSKLNEPVSIKKKDQL